MLTALLFALTAPSAVEDTSLEGGASGAAAACCAPADRVFTAEGPAAFAGNLFNTSDFPPRWYSGTWATDVGWLHIASDLAIAAAYFAIPLVLLTFLLRRPEGVPFPKIVWLFAAFILCCGVGHALEAAIFWWPAYRLAGLIKAVTAVVSLVTVVAVIRLMPKALALPGVGRLDRELREREAFLKSLLEASPFLISWKDAQGRLRGGNRRFAASVGLSEADELADREERLPGLSGEQSARIRYDDLRVIGEAEPSLAAEETFVIDGQERHFRVSKTPLLDEAGAVTGLLTMSEDVTEARGAATRLAAAQSRAERVLRASDARFAAFFDSDIVGMMSCRLTGEITHANESFLRMIGYTREDLKAGRVDWRNLTPEKWAEDDLHALGTIQASGRAMPYEKEYFHKNGTPVPVLLWATMVSPVEGETGGGECLCFILDMTDRRQAAEELRAAKASAEQANRAKSEFLANMSHEIRTPLNGILGFAELLRRTKCDAATRRRHLDTITTSGRHLLHLINDVLDLSKIEAGRVVYESEPLSPHSLISETLSVLRVEAEQKSISLEARWTTGVPETILGDAPRLRQVLTNLVGNAVKFTDVGGVRIVSGLNAYRPDGPTLTIEVHDTGVGIDEAAQARIFEPFDQADTSVTRQYGGTGLGLAISRRMVTGMGGTLTVSSRRHVGSKFTLELPARSLDDVEIHETPLPECLSKVRREVIPESLEGRRLLVCEDGRVNRELITLVLEEAGAEVVAVVNGAEGVNAVKAGLRTGGSDNGGGEPRAGGGFDLVLMDMQMPVMDGYAATRALRELCPDLPVFALTAHAMAGDERKALDAGCRGYLTKPIDIDELMLAVARGFDASSPAKNRGGEPTATSGGDPAASVAETATSATASGAAASSVPTSGEATYGEATSGASELGGETPAATADEPRGPAQEPAASEDGTTGEAAGGPPVESSLASAGVFDAVIGTFVDLLPAEIAGMREAVSRGEFEAVRETAHTLRGSGGTVGFDCVTEPVRAIESAAVAGDASAAQAALDAFEALAGRLVSPAGAAVS